MEWSEKHWCYFFFKSLVEFISKIVWSWLLLCWRLFSPAWDLNIKVILDFYLLLECSISSTFIFTANILPPTWSSLLVMIPIAFFIWVFGFFLSNVSICLNFFPQFFLNFLTTWRPFHSHCCFFFLPCDWLSSLTSELSSVLIHWLLCTLLEVTDYI